MLCYSYNRYLAIAARVVRRSLKDDKRLAAEKRGAMDLRFAKWNVSTPSGRVLALQGESLLMAHMQNGKQGEVTNVADANAAAGSDAAASS